MIQFVQSLKEWTKLQETIFVCEGGLMEHMPCARNCHRLGAGFTEVMGMVPTNSLLTAQEHGGL